MNVRDESLMNLQVMVGGVSGKFVRAHTVMENDAWQKENGSEAYWVESRDGRDVI